MGMENIRIVLAGPLYGGNIGSVCRAMANMGLSDLVVAEPRVWDMDEARKMACGGEHILAALRTVPTLAEAVADCGRVMGATARQGLYRAHARTARETAPLALEAAATARVALVFGREDKGLSNEEIALCTDIIRIPTAPAHTALNLAQAVLVCCYELFVASGAFAVAAEKSPESSSALRERMFGLWRELLLEIGFMKDDKADHMMLGLRRILSRGRLTEDDVRILMGIARQAQWAAGQGAPAGAADTKGETP